MSKQQAGLKILRRILRNMRWDDQGGYVGYCGDGKWAFASVGLGQVSPRELNALFAAVDLVPDMIIPLGSCRGCAHAVDGRERGYEEPCLSCKRPRMTNFVPAKALSRKGKTL